MTPSCPYLRPKLLANLDKLNAITQAGEGKQKHTDPGPSGAADSTPAPGPDPDGGQGVLGTDGTDLSGGDNNDESEFENGETDNSEMYHRLPEEGEGEGEGEDAGMTDTATYSTAQRVQGTGFYSDEEAMNRMRELDREEDWEEGAEGAGVEAGLDLAPLSSLPGGASERVMVSEEVEFNDDCDDDNDRDEEDDDDEAEEGYEVGEEYGVDYNCEVDEEEEDEDDEDEDEDDQFDSHDDGRDEDSEGDGEGGADGEGDSEEDGEPGGGLVPESDREVLYYAMLHCTALCYITALNRTTALYYTVLYFTVLCYTVTLYYTVLPYTM